MKKILFIILCLSFICGCGTNNSELLKKYTYEPSEIETGVFNAEYKIVNIEKKQSDNLFDTSYVRFKNISDDYENINVGENFYLNAKIYKSKSGISLMVWSVDEIEILPEAFSKFKKEEFKTNYPEVNIDEFLTRKKIENSFDLVNFVIHNQGLKMNEKNSKEEIIDKFIGDNLLHFVIPYSNESKVNKIIAFEGDIYGYSYIKDNQVLIALKNKDKEIRIIYEAENLSINEQQIIDLVSTVKF